MHYYTTYSLSDFEIILLKGQVPYQEGHGFMLELHERRRLGLAPDTLLMLEHAPVVTLGANAEERDAGASISLLKRRGVELVRTGRGGQATLHAPGQLVAYPIINLRERGLGVKSYVRALEESMIATANRSGVKARLRDSLVGVYCDSGKLGAVGIAVRGGVTLHGLALNVNPDLELFEQVVLCGRSDIPATSLSKESGREVDIGEVGQALAEELVSALGGGG